MQEINPQLFEKEIQQIEAMLKSQAHSENCIAFFGSSTFRMWSTMAEDLNPYPVLNLGFGGSSFPYAIYYFDRLFKDFRPKAIMFYFGDNDLGRGDSPNAIRKNFLRLCELIMDKWQKMPPFSIISVKPSVEKAHMLDKIAQTNALLQHEARALNGKWVNIYEKMLNENGGANSALYLADGLHLNETGYKIWQKNIREHLFDEYQWVLKQ
ncbi:GDSL-type esterase/lipase family protein [Persicobacter diffluens]|uniref:Lysophospholipase n=1 Tax=Persicobacter diffluens TaxID=981 RepID=A0AAN5AL18_9BACT|nr:lysophospholipase [Persicobacter diffluens]